MNIQRQSTLLQRGFTFLELVVVLVILGLLAAVSVPLVMRWAEIGRVRTTETNLKALAQAMDLYKLEIGSYPKQLQDLVEKPKGPEGAKWTGPQINKIPRDGWNGEIHYKVTPGGKHAYELYSDGPSGESGTEEERVDVWKL